MYFRQLFIITETIFARFLNYFRLSVFSSCAHKKLVILDHLVKFFGYLLIVSIFWYFQSLLSITDNNISGRVLGYFWLLSIFFGCFQSFLAVFKNFVHSTKFGKFLATFIGILSIFDNFLLLVSIFGRVF
jgi:hypothetical protein